MLNQEQYERVEDTRFRVDLRAVEQQTLRDRKEARESLRKCLAEYPEHFYTSCEHLIAGNYGYGAYKKFRDYSKTRMNLPAWLFNTVSALEFGCSQRFACQVWKEQPKHTKARIQANLERMIEDYKSSEE